MKSAYSLTSQDWSDFLRQNGKSDYLLPYWVDGLYKDQLIWQKHLSPDTMKKASESFHLELPLITRTQESEDGTAKFQVRFADGLEVETVLIPFHKRFTVCLSTQVGCGMNCSFCYTGTQGLKRNLDAGEIVAQYIVAKKWLKEKNPAALSPSIVFMGQGEPLHNAEEVGKAISVLSDRKLLGIGQRQMTLSTVGYLPAMDKLKSFSNINIALSLHSPFDKERSELIPVNQRFPLVQVLEKLDELPLLKKQFVTYEYLLVKDFNMTEAHADALKDLLSSRKAILNLIPFNPFPGSRWKRPHAEEIESFKNQLVSRKLRVMLRKTKGDDILAACGQLKINSQARNYAI